MHGTVEIEFGWRFLKMQLATCTIVGTRLTSSDFRLPPKPFLVKLTNWSSLEEVMEPAMLAIRVGQTRSNFSSWLSNWNSLKLFKSKSLFGGSLDFRMKSPSIRHCSRTNVWKSLSKLGRFLIVLRARKVLYLINWSLKENKNCIFDFKGKGGRNIPDTFD